ncbi:lipopolysaccharide biosynthesis protein [Mitsuaria sp. 7]|uniref:lipopolysaccharide biosynthesis protein n=1 Tax=Mitsuaria sp. 7 TaxID=1658665 RepID=UPI0007DD874D|nr:hypothetical protein [Mitsuaria sp. 7]ANH68940.1 hypothetical protein ABE85_17600 [Mitsuaria sp. 7]
MSDKDTARLQMRSVIAFFSGNLGATVLTLLATLMVTRWTPPHQLGLWNLMTVFISYASALQLGVFNAMNRQIPFLRGSGDTVKAELAGQVGLAWCLGLTGLTLMLGLVGIAYFAVAGTRDQMLTATAFVVVLASSWSLQFLTVGYSTAGAFGPLARRTTLIAIAGLPLALLAQLLGYAGLLLRAALVAVISSSALHYQRPLKVRPKWDGAMFRQLVRIGLPIWLLGQLGALFMTLDRLVLADSPQLLGYYAIAAQFAALAVMVPTAFNSVLYPQMSRSYGEHRSAMALWRQALRASLGMFAAGMAFAGICWLTIPTFVTMLLPAYAPAIEAARWTALAAAAMTFSAFGNVLNVLGRQDVYLVSSAVGGATFFATWKGLSATADVSPLVAAAQSMLLATFVTSVCAMLLCRLLCARLDRRPPTPLTPVGSA